ncbi:MAG: UDP-N-acetylmuramoyl-tripeptide--D-alanyl-D-alanine ligase [Candidatus Paceibacteria bacterium]
MIRLRVADIVQSTGCELIAGSETRELEGVSTDTRSLGANSLFVSLSGPNFDGNQFARAAVEGGAAALLLSGTPEEHELLRRELPAGVALMCHANPRRALADLGAWHRSRLDIPVVGVTGSCGKTTTKNILVELLSGLRKTVGSPSSFNNEIGVPHTLFLADKSTETLIVEMGTNNPGEISALCRMARPTGAILTNIGASHLEGLHTIEGVAREKSDLLACLSSSGFAVLGEDCPWTPHMRSVTGARVITFSVDGEGDLNATDVWFHSAGTTFQLEGREVTFPLLGLHNVQNLLAALAACRGLGIALDELLPHVSELSGGKRRLEKKHCGELTLLDDTYNANPESAKASVRVLAGIHGHDRRVLVLGDMLELGDLAAELHYAVGLHAAKKGIDKLFLVGGLTRATAAGALEGGLRAEDIVHYESLDPALVEIPDQLNDGDLVLIKGSRAMGLERLVAVIERMHKGAEHKMATLQGGVR